MPFEPDHVSIAPWCVVLAACLIAALTDLRTRRIPNVITLPMLASGLVVSAVSDGWWGLAEATLAATLLGLPYLLLFLVARGGGGDVKLMAAVGAWLGLSTGLAVLICVAIAGALLACFHVAIGHTRRRRIPPSGRSVVPADSADRSDPVELRWDAGSIPYGVAICLGAFAGAVWGIACHL